jgi:hypothetical protein
VPGLTRFRIKYCRLCFKSLICICGLDRYLERYIADYEAWGKTAIDLLKRLKIWGEETQSEPM